MAAGQLSELQMVLRSSHKAAQAAYHILLVPGSAQITSSNKRVPLMEAEPTVQSPETVVGQRTVEVTRMMPLAGRAIARPAACATTEASLSLLQLSLRGASPLRIHQLVHEGRAVPDTASTHVMHVHSAQCAHAMPCIVALHARVLCTLAFPRGRLSFHPGLHRSCPHTPQANAEVCLKLCRADLVL